MTLYKIIWHQSVVAFEREVIDQLKDGWKLAGGPFVDQGQFHQALTKEARK